MEKFKIGDKVIALTTQSKSNSQQRIKGEIYTINNIKYCSTDGHQMINLGYKTERNEISCVCGKSHNTYGWQWTSCKHFMKLNDINQEIDNSIIEN